MHFLIGLVIVLGIIYGMIVSPVFRAAALILLGIGATLLWMALGDPFGWKYARQEALREAANRAWQSSAISIGEIVLSDVILTPKSSQKRLGVPTLSYQYWTLEGTVANNSAVPINSLNFEITVRDSNRIIAQERVELCSGGNENYLVPAGQARAFHSCAIHFKDMPAAQLPTATYRVTVINGHSVQSEALKLLTQEQQEQQKREATPAPPTVAQPVAAQRPWERPGYAGPQPRPDGYCGSAGCCGPANTKACFQ
jgi:hypothetical protein